MASHRAARLLPNPLIPLRRVTQLRCRPLFLQTEAPAPREDRKLGAVPYCRKTATDQPRGTMNGHRGKRPGAGRPKGAASRANEEVRQEAAATGELPLAYMLRIMRDPSQPVGRRDDMAKAAAPFCHSRLSSVEHSGEISRPTVIRAPAVSATLEEWQAEYAPGAKEKH